jgi:hypothetical protein
MKCADGYSSCEINDFPLGIALKIQEIWDGSIRLVPA